MKAKGPIVNGAAFPTWITEDMLFKLDAMDHTRSLVRFISKTLPDKVIDVRHSEDREGTLIIVYRIKTDGNDNQIFKLENPVTL